MSPDARPGMGPWGRRRLLIALACLTSVGAALVFGLGYTVYAAVTPGPDSTLVARLGSGTNSTQVAPAAGHGRAYRDRIAAAPMLSVALDAARGGAPAATPAPTMAVPGPTRLGPLQVPTGYPRTRQGAVGQLAAIEVTVLQTMSIPQANAVYHAWALPGGTGAADWELTGDVLAFLGRNSVGQAKAVTTTVTASPAAAQVKGADGDAWVLACVLLQVSAVITTDAQIAYGYCERMQWTDGGGGRWMVAPGDPAARAPSTWPGTELSIRAGWRSWSQQASADRGDGS